MYFLDTQILNSYIKNKSKLFKHINQLVARKYVDNSMFRFE